MRHWTRRWVGSPVESLPLDICGFKEKHATSRAKDCSWCAVIRDARGYWKDVKGGAKQVFLSLQGRSEETGPEPNDRGDRGVPQRHGLEIAGGCGVTEAALALRVRVCDADGG